MKLEKNKVKTEKEESGGIMGIKQSYVMNVLVMVGFREDLDHFPKCLEKPPTSTCVCYDYRVVKSTPDAR
jgi:hypothetical protein